MRRALVVLALALPLLLCGCASLFQGVYDERAEDECEELRNSDAYRACINDLEDRQHQRRIERRTS